MTSKAAITVLRPRDEIERLWSDPAQPLDHIRGTAATVTFREAPGDRGTEIHVELPAAGRLKRLTGALPLAKVKDDLRHFKQLTETGETPRSDGSPEGERVERKLKQHPAQPLDDAELQKAGVR